MGVHVVFDIEQRGREIRVKSHVPWALGVMGEWIVIPGLSRGFPMRHGAPRFRPYFVHVVVFPEVPFGERAVSATSVPVANVWH